jgi:hypothetical protein
VTAVQNDFALNVGDDNGTIHGIKKSNHTQLGNCDSFMKRKILVINEMKQDKILLKLKV